MKKKSSKFFTIISACFIICLITACGGNREAQDTATIETIEEIVETEIETNIPEVNDDIGLEDILSTEQIEVLEEFLPYIICTVDQQYYQNNGSNELISADIEADQMINIFFNIMTNSFDETTILNCLDPFRCEKTSALNHIGDLFGKTLIEEDVTSYTNDYMQMYGYSNVKIDDDTISVIPYANGDFVNPSIDTCIEDGDKVIISVPYELSFFDRSWWTHEYIHSNIATVILSENPDSFWGYSMESISIEPDPEAVNAQGLEEQTKDVTDTELTDFQKEVIREAACPLIYLHEYSKETKIVPTEISIGNVITFIDYISWMDSIEFPPAVIGPNSYAKYALQNVSDILGQTISTEDIIAYNGSNFGWVMIHGDKLGCMMNEGELDTVDSEIESYVINEDQLIVTFTWVEDNDWDHYGNATLYFNKNEDSFFGYTLESMLVEVESGYRD